MNKFKLFSTAAYNNTTNWKTDADGKIELNNGNPVFINGSGQEMSVDHSTITRLNAEAKGHREAKETAERALKEFEGLDPSKAKEALLTVGKLDAKTLVDSGKVDELKLQITTQFQEQLAEKDKANVLLQGRLDTSAINDIFKGSDFARNRIAVPYDMFEATFKSNFKVEDGKVTAYGKDGNRLLSRSKAGEYADSEEALQLLVDAHPQKDQILKANSGSGSGSDGSGGNTPLGIVNIKRSAFNKLSPNEQFEISAKVGRKEMTLTD